MLGIIIVNNGSAVTFHPGYHEMEMQSKNESVVPDIVWPAVREIDNLIFWNRVLY